MLHCFKNLLTNDSEKEKQFTAFKHEIKNVCDAFVASYTLIIENYLLFVCFGALWKLSWI